MVAVPRQRRTIELGHATIDFVQLQPATLFGFQQIAYHQARLNVSDRERTILDCLVRFDLCGGVDEVARTMSVLVEDIAAHRPLDYLRRMDNQALTQRLGLILDRLSTVQTVDEGIIAGAGILVGEPTYPLDAHGPDRRKVDARWRVRVNVDVLRTSLNWSAACERVLDYYVFLGDLDDRDRVFLDLGKCLLHKPYPEARSEILKGIEHPLAWLMEGLPISEAAAAKTKEDIQIHLPDAGEGKAPVDR